MKSGMRIKIILGVRGVSAAGRAVSEPNKNKHDRTYSIRVITVEPNDFRRVSSRVKCPQPDVYEASSQFWWLSALSDSCGRGGVLHWAISRRVRSADKGLICVLVLGTTKTHPVQDCTGWAQVASPKYIWADLVSALERLPHWSKKYFRRLLLCRYLWRE